MRALLFGAVFCVALAALNAPPTGRAFCADVSSAEQGAPTIAHEASASDPGATAPAGGRASTPHEQVWLISTRGVGACMTGIVDAERFHYWRLDETHRWVTADWSEFRASDEPTMPTVLVVHGNRTGRSRAIRMAWPVLRQLRRDADDRSFRFVIWSWPADEIRGARRDAQVKAYRSDVQAFYLADVLRRMEAEVPVTAVGYSFGARIISGALHLAAGGELLGRSLESAEMVAESARLRRRPVRAVLVAAAMSAGSLLPAGRNGKALDLIDRALITRNSADPVLHFYPLMYGRGGPQAMGYVGPYVRGDDLETREKIELVSVQCSVGRAHDWNRYFGSGTVRRRVSRYAFDEGAQDADAAALQIAP